MSATPVDSLPQPEVAILVPVYRNAATVAELAKRIAGALADIHPAYRIVFVVDASPDDSWRIVQQLARNDGRICGILLERNQGQHRALMLGLQRIRARWVVVMDADMQDPPELLAELIDECERTGLTVFALRDGRYQSRGRMLTSRMFKYLLGWLIDLPVDAGSYFVVPESVAERMRCAKVKHVQLVVMARMFSPSWSATCYMRNVREAGMSAYSSWGRMHSAMRSLACVWECRRWMQGKSSVDLVIRQGVSPLIVERVNI